MKIIVLDSTAKSIKAVLASSVATSNPDFVVAYADTSDNTFSELSSDGQLNDTTDVTLVAAPASGVKRAIKSITIYNRDTAPVTVTIKLDISGTQRVLQRVQLVSGETWHSDELTKLAPGGSDTQVQFNDSGTLAGSSGLVYNKTTSTLTLGANPVLSGGTANAVAYLNASKVLTTGSALTFDGTNFKVGTAVTLATGAPYFSGANIDAGANTLAIGSGITGFFIGGSEAMRLTSTGLGIGTSSPSTKLTVFAGADGDIGFFRGGSTRQVQIGTSSTAGYINTDNGSAGLELRTQGTARAYLDNSGNLGLGVTPSAWGNTAKAFTIRSTGSGIEGSISNSGVTNAVSLTSNSYYASGWKYVYSGGSFSAGRYDIEGNTHSWYTAASGTAGAAITFTQAMTLDASGNLVVGNTSAWGKFQVSHTSNNSTTAATNVSDYQNSVMVLHNQDNVGTGNKMGLVFAFAGSPGILSGIDGYKESGTWNTGLRFYTNGQTGGAVGAMTERARITSGGYFKASVNGTYVGSTGAYHEMYQSTGTGTICYFGNNSTTPNGIQVTYLNAAPNGTGNEFLYCSDTGAQRATIRSNGGLANYSANNVNLSDRREKTNFAPAKPYLDTICAIPVQTFNYIDQNLEEDAGLTLGVVAQDVQAVAPELVMESNWGTEDDPKMRLSIYQTDLQYALMKCIQEQQALIATLTARVAALESN